MSLLNMNWGKEEEQGLKPAKRLFHTFRRDDTVRSAIALALAMVPYKKDDSILVVDQRDGSLLRIPVS